MSCEVAALLFQAHANYGTWSIDFACLFCNIGLYVDGQNCICMPIIFDNPLKSCFSNKKYFITIQTQQTKIVKFILITIKKQVFNGFLKIISVQN